MKEEDNSNIDNQSSRKDRENFQKNLSILFIIISILLLIFSSYIFCKYKNLEKTSNELAILTSKNSIQKDSLIQKLINIEIEYEELSKEYEGLDSLFNAEKDKVKALISEITQAKLSANFYKNKVNDLEKKLDDYVDKIKRLQANNENLTIQNFRYKYSLDSTITENSKLSNKNQELSKKINVASIPKAIDIVAEGIRNKGGKDIPSRKALKTEKIRICFVLNENTIADNGKKNLYLRITDINNMVMTNIIDNTNVFKHNGKNIIYTIKKEVYYDRKQLDVCVYWDNDKNFTPGLYHVDIFYESIHIGSTTLNLD